MPERRFNEDEARRWADQMREEQQAGASDYDDAFQRVEEQRALWEDNMYERASRIMSRRHEQQTAALQERVERAAPWITDRSSILMMPKVAEGLISGQTLPFHGIILVDSGLMRRAPESVTYAVAAHERTHLHIGGALRRSVFAEHERVDRFFHEVVLPDWRHETVDLPEPDHDFVSAKGWASLYDAWYGPTRVDFDQAKRALQRYFFLVERDLIDYNHQHDQLERSLMNPDEDFVQEKILPKKPLVPLHELYECDPKKFLKILITGYAVGEYLNDALKVSLMQANNVDLLDTEEGLANAVGMELAHVSEQDLNTYTRQDPAKLRSTRHIQALGSTAQEFLGTVHSYDQLVTLALRLQKQ